MKQNIYNNEEGKSNVSIAALREGKAKPTMVVATEGFDFNDDSNPAEVLAYVRKMTSVQVAGLSREQKALVSRKTKQYSVMVKENERLLKLKEIESDDFEMGDARPTKMSVSAEEFIPQSKEAAENLTLLENKAVHQFFGKHIAQQKENIKTEKHGEDVKVRAVEDVPVLMMNMGQNDHLPRS